MKNREILVRIYDYLATVSTSKAKKLGSLITLYDTEVSEDKKKIISKKIYDFIFNLFNKQLSRKCASDLLSLNVVINERCYELEHYYNYRWHVGFKGVSRISLNDEGKMVSDDFIPRTYLEGYKPIEGTLDEEGVDFYLKNEDRLDIISHYMDSRLERVTDLELKDNKVDPEFVNLLISYIGMSGLSPEEKAKRDSKVIPFKN